MWDNTSWHNTVSRIQARHNTRQSMCGKIPASTFLSAQYQILQYSDTEQYFKTGDALKKIGTTRKAILDLVPRD